MKANAVIITLVTLLSTNVFAQNELSRIHLKCQGTVDKSVELTADIEANGRGTLQIAYGTGDSLTEVSRKISLISAPAEGSDNYRFSTTNEDNSVSKNDEFTLDIRSQVIRSKLSGPTRNVNLFIKPALAGFDVAYGITCDIQQD